MHHHTEGSEELAARNHELQRELDRYQLKCDELHYELLAANKSLLTLTKAMEKNWEHIEVQIAAAIRLKIMPFSRQLLSDPALEKHLVELELLQQQLKQICTTLHHADSCGTATLSHTELCIATFVKHGYTSAEIAERLHISLDTVKTHRKRIRRKLNLHQTPANLKSYLQSQK